jgi:hypothetical protein
VGIGFSVSQIIDRRHLNLASVAVFIGPQHQSANPTKSIDPNPCDHLLPPEISLTFGSAQNVNYLYVMSISYKMPGS